MAEVQAKAQSWKTFDETEQQRRQAMYKDVLAQQQSVRTCILISIFWLHAHLCELNSLLCHVHPQLTLRIQAILNSRRNQVMQVSVTTSSTNNAGKPVSLPLN